MLDLQHLLVVARSIQLAGHDLVFGISSGISLSELLLCIEQSCLTLLPPAAFHPECLPTPLVGTRH